MKVLTYKRPESVLVLIHAASRILLLKRNDMPDFWQSVTGSLDAHESNVTACAQRELFEETGLSAQKGILTNHQYAEWFEIYSSRLKRYPPGVCYNYEHRFSFELQQPIDIRMSTEHSEYCWVTKKEAMARVKSPTNLAAIADIIAD